MKQPKRYLRMPLEEENNEADLAQVRAFIRTYHLDNKSSEASLRLCLSHPRFRWLTGGTRGTEHLQTKNAENTVLLLLRCPNKAWKEKKEKKKPIRLSTKLSYLLLSIFFQISNTAWFQSLYTSFFKRWAVPFIMSDFESCVLIGTEFNSLSRECRRQSLWLAKVWGQKGKELARVEELAWFANAPC